MKRAIIATYLIVLYILSINTAMAKFSDGTLPYFPFTPGTEWAYDNGNSVLVAESIFSASIFFTIIENSDETGNIYLNISEDKVQRGVFINPHFIMTANYFAPKVLLQPPLQAGTTWKETLSSNGYHPEITCTYTSDNLSVEAGGKTYNQCLELIWEIDYPDGYDWENPLVMRKLYFDKDIGCIKRIDIWQDGSESSIELLNATLGPEFCQGDFSGDGDVDGLDLSVLSAHFGRTDCNGDCEGDFDQDGDVDGADLSVFAADFGRTNCP